jgi:protein phosphatase
VTIAWQAAGATHTGRRRRGNEDAHRLDADRGVFLVADGMGGHAAGEVASGITSATVERVLAEAADAGTAGEGWDEALRGAARQAHDEISRCCSDDPRKEGMGTTLTACVLEPDGACHIGHIGDSRAYLLRDGDLVQLTDDHTWVRREVEAGRVAPEAADKHPLAHILTRVLSAELSPEIDVVTTRLLPGDLLLLATDGLYNMVPDPTIRSLLAADAPLPATASALIAAANRAGGADNITVVLVRVMGAVGG